MHAPVRTVAPAAPVITTAEAKAHLRVDGSDEDTLIDVYVAAAADHLDGWTGVLGRALVTQTWRQDFDAFDRCMRLPVGPVASVTSVTYLDAAGDSQTVAAPNYQLLADALGAYVRFSDDYPFPTVADDGPAVSVTYVAGVAAAAVPAALKAALLLLVGHYFANREAVITGTIATALPLAVNSLIAPYRRVGV